MEVLLIYGKIGLSTGAIMFAGNLLSVLIPDNTQVDPNYQWNNLSWSRFEDSIMISATKAVIVGLQWPILAWTIMWSMFGSVSAREKLRRQTRIGYVYSPHRSAGLSRQQRRYEAQRRQKAMRRQMSEPHPSGIPRRIRRRH